MNVDLDSVPEHMRKEAEFYDHFAPEFYHEADCLCERRIYKYELDLIVEWKHIDSHSTYCNTQQAKPRT